jgi:arylsulfatase A-like enzyme
VDQAGRVPLGRHPQRHHRPLATRDPGKGQVRTQFHHVIDVAPTILELAGLPHPVSVDGVQQKPLEGVSMSYSFDDPGAAERHETQYFEMSGTAASTTKAGRR